MDIVAAHDIWDATTSFCETYNDLIHMNCAERRYYLIYIMICAANVGIVMILDSDCLFVKCAYQYDC